MTDEQIMKKRAKALRYRRKHSSAGICVNCPRPAVPDRSLCEMHLEAMREKARLIYRAKHGIPADAPLHSRKRKVLNRRPDRSD